MGNEIAPYKKKTSHLDVFNTLFSDLRKYFL